MGPRKRRTHETSVTLRKRHRVTRQSLVGASAQSPSMNETRQPAAIRSHDLRSRRGCDGAHSAGLIRALWARRGKDLGTRWRTGSGNRAPCAL